MGKDIYNNVKCRHRIAINKLLESLLPSGERKREIGAQQEKEKKM